MCIRDRIRTKLLNQKNPQINQGEIVGKVYNWDKPSDYNHIHVNVIQGDGTWINPEYVFNEIKDTKKPNLKVFYALNDSRSFPLNAILPKTAVELILQVNDPKENSKYWQLPSYYELSFNGGDQIVYDFRKSYDLPEFQRKKFTEVYPKFWLSPFGRYIGQRQDYYPTNNPQFYIKMPIPKNRGNGSGIIKVKDQSGNESIIQL